MFPSRVFVDANVLYSRTLRDWLALLQLRSDGEIYSVYWSEDVLCEAIYHLRRKHPDWDGAKITRIRDLHVRVFEHGRVADFAVDGSFPGSDSNDQHRRVTREQTEYWRRRRGRAALTEHLMNANCPEFAQRVLAHQTQLSLPS